MRVWLDDIRKMPKGFDVWVQDSYSACVLIGTGKVTHLSFDHDLGLFRGCIDSNNTGYTVAKEIELCAYLNQIHPLTWDIHSANPVGRKNIEMAMRSAERFWQINLDKKLNS